VNTTTLGVAEKGRVILKVARRVLAFQKGLQVTECVRRSLVRVRFNRYNAQSQNSNHRSREAAYSMRITITFPVSYEI
jgi:hypothetical protein